LTDFQRLFRASIDAELESLQDPAEAAAYLDAALEDEDSRDFLLALRDVAEARGISQVAAEADLNRESLYRMLSEEGNPRLSSLGALLRSFGLRLAIEVRESAGLEFDAYSTK
jgi:probable addiction module antidote protein